MCENCKNNEDAMYPDLGHGSMMEIDTKKTWLSADKDQGLRIAQKRHVTYMGPEGVQSREETDCVYISWDRVEETIYMMLALEMKAKENDENSPD